MSCADNQHFEAFDPLYLFLHPSVFGRRNAEAFGEGAIEGLAGGEARFCGYGLYAQVLVGTEQREGMVETEHGEIAGEGHAVTEVEVRRERSHIQFGEGFHRLVAVEERVEIELVLFYRTSQFLDVLLVGGLLL